MKFTTNDSTMFSAQFTYFRLNMTGKGDLAISSNAMYAIAYIIYVDLIIKLIVCNLPLTTVEQSGPVNVRETSMS